MPTLYFTGDQVAFFGSIDDGSSKHTLFDDVVNPFLATDQIQIVINDNDVLANGEFDPDLVRFESVTVIRDGVSYEFAVGNGSKVKETGGSDVKEQGDTFFITNDSVGPPDSGPFAGLEEGQMVFSASDTFATGDVTKIKRDQKIDLNGDGDTNDPGEGKDGNFNVFQSTSPPCFLAGTMILTPDGERPVEAIRTGDTVCLLGGGTTTVLMAPRQHVVLRGSDDSRRPVEVGVGSLGPNLPCRPLSISPQHAVHIGGQQLTQLQAVASDEGVCQLRAAVLDELPGVSRPRRQGDLTYYTLLLSRYGCIIANGAAVYSLWPGPRAISGFSVSELTLLELLFPGVLRDPEHAYGSCGPFLKRRFVQAAARARNIAAA